MKSKFIKLLNIITICMCFMVLAVGVYAANTVSLTVSGRIGFTAVNCKVNVTGYIYGHAQGATVDAMKDGQPTPAPTEGVASTYVYLTANNVPKEVSGNDNELSLGTRYFTDMASATGKPEDIYIVLQVTNASNFQVEATVDTTALTFGKVKATVDNTSAILDVSGNAKTAEFTFKLELQPDEEGGTNYSNITTLQNVALNMTFEKYEAPPVPLQGNNIKYNLTANNATVDVTSTKVGYATSATTVETTRQNIQMDTDNTITVTNTDGNGTTSTVDVGKLEFANIDPTTPIVLTLTATNKSSTQVASMIVIDEIHDTRYTIEYAMGTNPDATKTAYSGAVILNASASVTFTITLNGLKLEEAPTNDLIISAEFTKYTTIQSPYNDETQGLIYTLNDAGTAWSVRGDYLLEYDDDDFEWDFVYDHVKSDIVIAESLFGIPVVKIEDNAFGYYDYYGPVTYLTSVTIPDSVTTIGNDAFAYCESLTSITIPDSVTSIGNDAFEYCVSLTSVNILDRVTTIGYCAFYYCHNLTSITIPDSVTTIGDDAFAFCTSLTSINIPDSVTSIGDRAFQYCNSLTSVSLGYYSVTSIGDRAFDGCYKLVEVINKSNLTLTLGGTDNGYVAYYAKQIMSDESQSKLKTDANGYLIYDDIETSKKILVGYTGTQTEITIPSGITEINQGAFVSCSSLTSITIPDSVTSIGDYAFWDCSSLTSITIPDGVTSIGDSAFRSCSSLTSIVIPDSVTSIGDSAFEYCSSLTSVNIPDGVTSIGNYAFRDCDSLTSVNIPDGVTSIGNYAFRDCDSLTSINIPDSVTSIGKYAFEYCSSLTSVYIDGATALSTAVRNYSSSYIFNYTTAVYIQKDVNMSGYTKFTKQGTGTYSYNGKTYYKYTETY